MANSSWTRSHTNSRKPQQEIPSEDAELPEQEEDLVDGTKPSCPRPSTNKKLPKQAEDLKNKELPRVVASPTGSATPIRQLLSNGSKDPDRVVLWGGGEASAWKVSKANDAKSKWAELRGGNGESK